MKHAPPAPHTVRGDVHLHTKVRRLSQWAQCTHFQRVDAYASLAMGAMHTFSARGRITPCTHPQRLWHTGERCSSSWSPQTLKKKLINKYVRPQKVGATPSPHQAAAPAASAPRLAAPYTPRPPPCPTRHPAPHPARATGCGRAAARPRASQRAPQLTHPGHRTRTLISAAAAENRDRPTPYARARGEATPGPSMQYRIALDVWSKELYLH